MMQRREFIKQTIGTGIVGAGAITGCATTGIAGSGSAAPPGVDIDAYVAQMDYCLDAISRGVFTGESMPLGGSLRSDPADSHLRDALIRKALTTLTVTGMAMDLDEHDRAHPAVQSRLWSSAAETDAAVRGIHAMLTTMPEADRMSLRQVLRDDPTLMGRMADGIDAKAELIQLPAKRRRHLKRLIGEVGWRLREQDPSLLIDDVTSKVSRVAQRAAQVADPAVTTMSPVMMGPTPYAQLQAPPPPRAPEREGGRGRGLAIGGGITLATGLLAAGVGAAVFNAGLGAGVAGLFGVTVGAILLVLGVVAALAGVVLGLAALVQWGTSD